MLRRRRRTASVDVQALGADFVAISPQKPRRPQRSRRALGRRELLETMSLFNLGGEMIRSVGLEKTTFNDLPHKFEAGTPAIAEAVGFGAAIDYVRASAWRRSSSTSMRSSSRR